MKEQLFSSKTYNDDVAFMRVSTFQCKTFFTKSPILFSRNNSRCFQQWCSPFTKCLGIRSNWFFLLDFCEGSFLVFLVLLLRTTSQLPSAATSVVAILKIECNVGPEPVDDVTTPDKIFKQKVANQHAFLGLWMNESMWVGELKLHVEHKIIEQGNRSGIQMDIFFKYISDVLQHLSWYFLRHSSNENRSRTQIMTTTISTKLCMGHFYLKMTGESTRWIVMEEK